MALTRLFFALLLVCCLSFAIEKPALWDQMNMKARQKWERAVSTGYKGKSTGPSARDKYWASMRSDDSHNNTVPTHRYVEAQNYFLSQPTKRYYNSPWTNIGPNSNNPVGGRTRAILVTPTGTLYAGCVSGGLWKSTNGGNSWTVLTDMMANIAVSTVAMDSSGSIYVGTGEGFNSADAKRGNGIFKSRNDVFSQLSVTSNSDFYYVNKIVISDKDEIYAATRTGLFRSIDSGASFSLLLKGNMMDAAIAKLNGNNVIMTWNSGYGLFSSVDGSTFKQVIGTSSQDNSMFRGSISVSPSLPSVVYISLSSNSGNMVNVYKSTDSGQSFTGKLLWDSSNAGKLNKALLSNPYYNFDTGNGMSCATSVKAGGYNQGWYNNAIAVHPLDPNTVFIGGVDLFKSNDGGRTFHLISTWWTTNSNYLHADQHTIIFSHNNSTVYIGNDGGVYKSENINIGYYDNPCSPPSQNIPSFTPLNSNYGTLQFYHGSVANSMLVGGTQDNGSWKYSSTWGVISGGDGGFTAIDGNNIYTSNTYTSISRHNSGNTTKMVGVGDLDGNGIFINPFVVYNSTVFTCAKSCWRRYGDKWERIGNAIGVDISALYVNKDMYVGSVSGGFWRLENGNWNKVGTNSLCNTCGEFYISSITVHPSISERVFVTISSFGDPHLWQSNDRGNTWFSLSHNIPDVPVLDLLIASSSTFYLGTDLGVLYSEDNGTNWSWVNQYGLANVPVYKLGLSGNNVYAFSHGRGVYRTVMTTSGTGDWHGSTLSSTIWADGDGVGMESTKSETKSGKKLGMWIIVGISAGGGIFVVFIVVLSIVLVRRKNRKRSESQEQILSVPVGMANNAM